MIADCLISFLTELVLMQECKGVDLNRNFGYHWGGYGASDNPCKETFRGSSAFSEPESRAIRDFLLSRENKFVLYLTFHSYGQYILYPWGYDKLDTQDWRELQRVGDITRSALRRLNHGVTYQVGSAAKMLYPASGQKLEICKSKNQNYKMTNDRWE